jgi:hypothetical protein
MCTALPPAAPASPAQALGMLEAALGYLADADATAMPAEALAECVRGLERADAIGAAARGRLLAAFDAKDGHLAGGHRSTRAWLVHSLRVTRAQAAEHLAVAGLARGHAPLLAGLREGGPVTRSVALQLARWARAIPGQYREQAEQILVAAARAGADLAALARIAAEIRYRTAPPDEDGRDPGLDRGLSLDATLDGAGVLRGDLTPQCAAMVRAVLDALAAPGGAGDLRTGPQRYHDALGEAMRRLLASGLLPQRAGQPVKALTHIYFAELCERDGGGVLQDKWITEYRALWAGHRAAAAVSPGDGGAWLEGDAARAVACDAMIVPVVTGDIDPAAVENLIGYCVEYHRIRSRAAADDGSQASPSAQPGTAAQDAAAQDAAGTASAQDRPRTQHETGAQGGATAGDGDGIEEHGGEAGLQGGQAGAHGGGTVAAPDAPDAPPPQAGGPGEVLAMLEHQILAAVIQVVSGPGGVASFLRRSLLGRGLNGPSLPLDVGRTAEIPPHLRRLVSLRDQRCQFPGGCDQPATACEPHHVVHRADGGRTSLAGLKDYCWWHHHVLLHQMGWQLTVHPDGTSQVTSPDGKIIRSHSPPPRPG